MGLRLRDAMINASCQTKAKKKKVGKKERKKEMKLTFHNSTVWGY